MIVITNIESRRSFNPDCSVIDEGECRSEYGYDFKEKCNGEQTCVLKIQKYNQKIGEYGSTSNFESNRINIFYSCIPSKWFFLVKKCKFFIYEMFLRNT
jgi:hypothetical protein